MSVFPPIFRNLIVIGRKDGSWGNGSLVNIYRSYLCSASYPSTRCTTTKGWVGYDVRSGHGLMLTKRGCIGVARLASRCAQRWNGSDLAILSKARFRFSDWERESRAVPIAPLGRWRTRQPVSLLFWCCPPEPPALNVSTVQSFIVTVSTLFTHLVHHKYLPLPQLLWRNSHPNFDTTGYHHNLLAVMRSL